MSVLQQPFRSGTRTAREGAPPSPVVVVRPAPPVRETPLADAVDEPSILGFPAEIDRDDEPPAGRGSPDGAAVRLVVLRRADPLAGSLLVLAGVAAGVSLWLPWARGADIGLSLVLRGVDTIGAGIETLERTGLWQPLAVVLGGGALLLLGLLLFRPARTHRIVGVLALVVAMAAAAGVLVPLALADWRIARFDLGMWFAVAVAGLGILGALKAMLTVPRVALEPTVGWSALPGTA